LTRHWRATFGEHVHEMCYENLVANPEMELWRLLSALQMDWHPDVFAFADREGFVATASRQQGREPVRARSLARGRNYEYTLQPILARLHAIAAQDALDAVSLSRAEHGTRMMESPAG
jgi:hypothetical protein